MDDNKIKRLVLALISVICLLMNILLFKGKIITKSGILRKYIEADLIIDAGGGTIFSSNKYYLFLGLYQHLFNLGIGKYLKKRVIMAPQSIGPFNKSIDEYVAKKVIGRLDTVMVREPISARLLQAAKVPHTLVPDSVFLNNFVSEPSSEIIKTIGKLKKNPLNIGITVLDWKASFPETAKSTIVIHDYLCKLANVCTLLGTNLSLAVSIIIQVKGDTDIALSYKLREMLEVTIPVEIIGEDCNVSDLCHLYGAMDIVIASRLHSAIFSMLQAVPVIALSYQPKIKGTYEMLGLEEYVFDIRNFTSEELYRAINGLLADYQEVRDRFAKVAAAAHHEAMNQFDFHLKPLLT